MGLMGEWDVLLLDEVTVDLDVLVRSELLAFLIKESEERGATIVCKFQGSNVTGLPV
jgi:CCR4-NOT complex subunit CAF16